ncbi:DUF4198 domain-containing protein [Photobacterium atrarenae]|uniref:DUF4198 domain-containing protein n=1 Tax=Photobacterium atrarenae TaxID=865757 RepID=A0ABY5GHY0_9GAMM|nr:DUF4198 domain-containing protein [Photobacterium atrarenae]UTV28817.1 DUF4198 domain-containing protein [Photobacterium atrarenae]
MNKVQLVLAAATVTMSSAAFADIKISDRENGAWVTVTHEGAPAANATVSIVNLPQVRQKYKTDENGRVFLPISVTNSRSVKFRAVTQEGNVYSKFAFHADKKR